MVVSQNGWPASPDPEIVRRVALVVHGVGYPGGVRAGIVESVLGHFLSEIAGRVEAPVAGQCWGGNYRKIAGSETYSNHASYTAADHNSLLHPQGKRGTYSPEQVKEIRRIQGEFGDAIFWGGDFTGTVDEMHFEVAKSSADLEKMVKMRRMYDSTNPWDIPGDAQIVAGYVSGPYAWPASGWARFAGIPQVRIATQAVHNVGNCLDVERGDATPEQAPDWVLRARARGEDPIVYVNELNGWAAVRHAFQSRGIPEPHYWVAHYDGVRAIPDGAVAKQFKGSAQTGGHWDESIAVDFWPGIDGGDMGVTPAEIDQIAAAVWARLLPNPHKNISNQAKDILWEGNDAAQRGEQLLKTMLPVLLQAIQAGVKLDPETTVGLVAGAVTAAVEKAFSEHPVTADLDAEDVAAVAHAVKTELGTALSAATS